MRKLKSNSVKEINHKMIKVKPKIIESDSDKHRALISIAQFIIVRQISNLFKFDKQFKLITKSTIPKLIFDNKIITEDSFKKEFTIFKSFMSLVYGVGSTITEDILYERLSYTKNIKADFVFKQLVEIEFDKIMSFMKFYLSDISLRIMLINNIEYIRLLASFKVLRDVLKETKNDEIIKLYDKDYIKVLRSLSTKLYNLIPSSLKELTGREEITTEHIQNLFIKANSIINEKINTILDNIKLTQQLKSR